MHSQVPSFGRVVVIVPTYNNAATFRRVGAAALGHEGLDHSIERQRIPLVLARQIDEAVPVMRRLGK